jgi:hypothetical protein
MKLSQESWDETILDLWFHKKEEGLRHTDMEEAQEEGHMET